MIVFFGIVLFAAVVALLVTKEFGEGFWATAIGSLFVAFLVSVMVGSINTSSVQTWNVTSNVETLAANGTLLYKFTTDDQKTHVLDANELDFGAGTKVEYRVKSYQELPWWLCFFSSADPEEKTLILTP